MPNYKSPEVEAAVQKAMPALQELAQHGSFAVIVNDEGGVVVGYHNRVNGKVDYFTELRNLGNEGA